MSLTVLFAKQVTFRQIKDGQMGKAYRMHEKLKQNFSWEACKGKDNPKDFRASGRNTLKLNLRNQRYEGAD
jgi:hypothetical protein